MVIRPTTPRTKTPCVMTTEFWCGQRTKFQSPRHVKVVPKQYTTETTTDNSSVKGEHVSTVYVPVTPSTRVIFVTTLEFPDCTDSLTKGGPRRESVWLALRKHRRCKEWSERSSVRVSLFLDCFCFAPPHPLDQRDNSLLTYFVLSPDR